MCDQQYSSLDSFVNNEQQVEAALSSKGLIYMPHSCSVAGIFSYRYCAPIILDATLEFNFACHLLVV